MTLLGQYLEKNEFELWNLGHAFMEYKIKLGAKVFKRMDFLNRWFNAIK